MAILNACNERREADQELAIAQAWLTACLSRAKKIPPLSKLTGKQKAPEKQTPEQLLANVRRLKSIFGGNDG